MIYFGNNCDTERFSTKHFYADMYNHIKMSLVVRKPVFGVFDQVRHKPGCTTTEDGLRLEISDLDSRGIVLSV